MEEAKTGRMPRISRMLCFNRVLRIDSMRPGVTGESGFFAQFFCSVFCSGLFPQVFFKKETHGFRQGIEVCQERRSNKS